MAQKEPWNSLRNKGLFLIVALQILGCGCVKAGNTDGGVLASLDPAPVNITWKWQQTLYNNGTRSLPPNPENYTVRLLPDGRVSIRADCNLGGGVYALKGGEISIEITHTTRAACPPESLEQTYIRDLNVSARHRTEGDFLYLHLKNDAGTMKFMR